MFLAINMILVAVLCALAVVKEARRKNFFAVGFAGISLGVFGWFGVMSLYAVITTGSAM